MQLKVLTLIQTCKACPSQWDLTLEDDPGYAYVRYRWGTLRLDTAHTKEDWVQERQILTTMDIGPGFHGEMETSEMQKLLSPWLDFSEVRDETPSD